ncbi:polyamine ABC transporter substrate-binding protein [Microbacterium sp. ASV49]|uniref:Spermidine/putrescine ABC transporter substrate-binding protein n=1 Tax=Microbacterium candidum TaxID=3041922 RepID=A0ABT7MVT2_9MICO|nr:spermidine/putrescine ABC transporter substrate-binding protein [Microbacterium sp. ASV49]MDL9978551.1 spermidine/putrescine ABC transporter substrate-binding protein [Microbacterium sp. ASV49]
MPEQVNVLAHRSAMPKITRELTRRGFLVGAGAAGLATLLAACTPGGSGLPNPAASGGKLEGSLSMYSWGDYDSPDVLKAYQKKFGQKLTVSSFGSNEEMVAKLVAARGTSGYDIVVPTGSFIAPMAEHKLLQKLDHALIPNLAHMDPEFLGRSWDPHNDYSICKAWGTTGFIYDTTKIHRELKTWSDFVDAAQKEASGSTSVLDDPAELTGIYFWGHGIDWNTTNKKELDDAETYLLKQLAPHVATFDSNPGGSGVPQSTQALFQIWNGDARQGILNSKQPEKWKWVLGSPATELWMDNWALAANAPHPEAAHAFLNFCLTPENQLSNVDYIGYHTGAKDIEKSAQDAQMPLLDMVFFTPEQLGTMHDGKLTSAQDRLVEIYDKMKAVAGA